MAGGELTVTGVLGEASRTLAALDAGYRAVEAESPSPWPTDAVRVFEDAFGVVAVVVFETWEALTDSWQDAQTALVDLLSAHVTTAEPKAWDGYLVLLTPGTFGGDQERLDTIRYNTSRVRKLVAAAPELLTLSDVRRALLPLLPLRADGDLTGPIPALSMLTDALADQGFEQRVVSGLLEAFANQRPLVEQLHQLRLGR